MFSFQLQLCLTLQTVLAIFREGLISVSAFTLVLFRVFRGLFYFVPMLLQQALDLPLSDFCCPQFWFLLLLYLEFPL